MYIVLRCGLIIIIKYNNKVHICIAQNKKKVQKR